MLKIDGFRLIKVGSGSITENVVSLGAVNYIPSIKYEIVKTNAFDPTKIIMRNPYHEDAIDCEAVLSPTEYEVLLDFIVSGQEFYLEFDVSGETKQLPVVVEKLPKMEEDTRFNTNKMKLSFKSIYKNYTPIDFSDTFGWGNSWGSNWGF